MSRPELNLSPHRSAMDRFGYELRSWRKARGLSQVALGTKIHVSGDLVRLVEIARRRPTRDFAERCDRTLDTVGALIRLWEAADIEWAAHRSTPTDTDKHIVGIDAPSERFSQRATGETIVVQMTSLIGEPVAVAIDRRTLLGGIAALPAIACLGPGVLGTTGLPAPVADGELADVVQNMTRLRSLLIEQDNILGPGIAAPTAVQQIQVLQRLSRASTGRSRLLLMSLQAAYAEFAGWLADDLGDRQAGQYWIDRALEWAHEGDDDQAVGYVLLRKAQRAADVNDASSAVHLAQAAQRRPSLTPRMRAAALQYEAQGHALTQELAAFRNAIDQSRELVTGVAPVSGEYAPWCNEDYITIHEAAGWMRLDQPNQAATVYAHALTNWPGQFRRDEGVYWGRLAHAYTAAGNPEQATIAGRAALDIAAQTGSARITTELMPLPAALAKWQRVAAVQSFVGDLNHVLSTSSLAIVTDKENKGIRT